jgi:beta-glucosidase
VTYADGTDPAAAARLAAGSDVAVVFVNVWSAESLDAPLALPDGQDALVEAVAKANPHTIVVLETGGPILMPWLDRVGAVLAAWYPGTRGGEAIASVLFGQTNPSGRLPITFPKSEDQLPRPKLDGDPAKPDAPIRVAYTEGAAVGYKWFDRQKLEPLFPFGYGLSYSRFEYGGLQARADGGAVTIAFDVRNTGDREGKDTPQVYIGPAAGGWEAPRRLAAWRKVSLKPGGVQHVTLTVDPRLLATYDTTARAWRIAAGDYQVFLGASSRSLGSPVSVQLPASTLPASYRAP